jgi:hypothetical protein
MMSEKKLNSQPKSTFFRRLSTINSFLGHCLNFAARDAISAAFGWATLVNAAAVVYLGHQWGLSVNPSQGWVNTFEYAVLCFLIGMLIAFFINLFLVSPVKAYRFMRPLVLAISGTARSPDFVFNETTRGYSSTVVVKNRSHSYLLDCTVHVVNLTRQDGSKFARFVEKFDLPPKSTKHIYFAHWFARETPNADDTGIRLNGSIGGWGGNIFELSSEGEELLIKVELANVEAKYIRCRVWVDRKLRELRTIHLGR